MARPDVYQGSELELFRNARNWKAYLAQSLAGYLAGRVIAVGAGLGSTTAALCGPTVTDWLCLEPDIAMARGLTDSIAEGRLPTRCRAKCGTTASLDADEMFDAALYLDVLEHIEDDVAELARISRHVGPAGRIVVLSPAHQWLFSPFDAAVGHFRRYRRADAAALTPSGWILERADYLDSVGAALSLANKLFLRQSMPTLGQVLFWDRWVIPLSRIVDRWLGHRFGKSILFVWRRAQSGVTPP